MGTIAFELQCFGNIFFWKWERSRHWSYVVILFLYRIRIIHLHVIFAWLVSLILFLLHGIYFLLFHSIFFVSLFPLRVFFSQIGKFSVFFFVFFHTSQFLFILVFLKIKILKKCIFLSIFGYFFLLFIYLDKVFFICYH